METMQYSPRQNLNEWSDMLGHIYEQTQNYFKSAYEIHSHMTEVTGAFGKLAFKKRDFDGAAEFLPKMFVWAIALSRKMKIPNGNIEDSLLMKYPRVCPYCRQPSCTCWSGNKKEIDAELVLNLYHQQGPRQGKSVNDFQLMFRNIYGQSWGLDNPKKGVNDDGFISMRSIYTRLVEELSETAEAIRFHHLYPSHFYNELADYFAWWFALVSNFNRFYEDGRSPILAQDMLWSAYPGFCLDCEMDRCDCRSLPVRELLSKPALNDLAALDSLTQAENRRSFDAKLDDIRSGKYRVAVPIACIVLDLDHFKSINDGISHDAGDTALRIVANAIRQKIRPRDRLFRLGGDEFAILCPDFSAAEAEGMMQRVSATIKDKPIKGKKNDKEVVKTITLSVGISICSETHTIQEKFQIADAAAAESKEVRDKILIR